MPATQQDISIERGDTAYIDFTVGGLAFDLDECSIRFTAKRSRLDLDEDAVVVKDLTDGIVVTSPTGATITLDPIDTEGVAPPVGIRESSEAWVSSLYYDIQLRTPSDEVFTVAKGRLLISIDVTQVTVP